MGIIQGVCAESFSAMPGPPPAGIHPATRINWRAVFERQRLLQQSLRERTISMAREVWVVDPSEADSSSNADSVERAFGSDSMDSIDSEAEASTVFAERFFAVESPSDSDPGADEQVTEAADSGPADAPAAARDDEHAAGRRMTGVTEAADSGTADAPAEARDEHAAGRRMPAGPPPPAPANSPKAAGPPPATPAQGFVAAGPPPPTPANPAGPPPATPAGFVPAGPPPATPANRLPPAGPPPATPAASVPAGLPPHTPVQWPGPPVAAAIAANARDYLDDTPPNDLTDILASHYVNPFGLRAVDVSNMQNRIVDLGSPGTPRGVSSSPATADQAAGGGTQGAVPPGPRMLGEDGRVPPPGNPHWQSVGGCVDLPSHFVNMPQSVHGIHYMLQIMYADQVNTRRWMNQAMRELLQSYVDSMNMMIEVGRTVSCTHQQVHELSHSLELALQHMGVEEHDFPPRDEFMARLAAARRCLTLATWPAQRRAAGRERSRSPRREHA